MLLQPDEVFDAESNGRYFSSLAHRGLFSIFYKVTSLVDVGVFQIFFAQMKV